MTNWIWHELGTIALLESMTEEGVIIVDVRDLSDVETDVDKVKQKILIVANLLCMNYRIAVRCVGGINRSNGIALAVMCYMVPKGDLWETWEYHFKKLKKKVLRAHITPQLQRTIKKALESLRDWEKTIVGHKNLKEEWK